MPYTSEEIYQNLTGEESVHLSDWPKPHKNMIKPLFNEEVRIVRQIVNLGHAVRAKARVKVRQPLPASIGLPEDVSPELVLVQKDVILEELNVKEIEFINDVSDVGYTCLYAECQSSRAEIRQGRSKNYPARQIREFTVLPDSRVQIGDLPLMVTKLRLDIRGWMGLMLKVRPGWLCFWILVITDELKNEGIAREVVRYVQEMRKEASYNVDDRIFVIVETEDHGVAWLLPLLLII